MKRAADFIPPMTIEQLKAALRHGAELWARGLGHDARTISQQLIDHQAVAVRSAARRFIAHDNARAPAARTIRDPSDGSVREERPSKGQMQ